MKDKSMHNKNYSSGFPKGVHFTPVPSPLLGPMLEQIGDYNDLVCILRFINLIHLKKGSHKWVEENLLISDQVLHAVIGSKEKIQDSINKCINNGFILRASLKTDRKARILVLNTSDAKTNIDRIVNEEHDTKVDVIENNNPTENIFTLYENNIGTLNPLITEELKYAQQRYPDDWINEAFREAVKNNARSWRYIETILENWHINGRSKTNNPNRRQSGRNRRHIKEIGQSASKRY
tara:strand:- start:12151 stop:12858 length:708 start_codon:yes stop_codon:yes gene_type:complete